jgi:hypothetical protein
MLSTELRARGSAVESGIARRIGEPFGARREGERLASSAVRERQRPTSDAGFAFPSSPAPPRLNPHPSSTEGMRRPQNQNRRLR